VETESHRRCAEGKVKVPMSRASSSIGRAADF
jgi:hypothetical protein